MPGNPTGLTAGAIQALKDLYQQGNQEYNEWFQRKQSEPLPPDRPSMFQADPFVVGRPAEAQAIKQLIDLNPRAKSRITGVTVGPTTGSMREMVRAKLPIDKFSGTSLMGAYELDKHGIGLNPHLENKHLLSTAAHEIGHAAGHGEKGANAAGAIVETDFFDQRHKQLEDYFARGAALRKK